MQPQPQIRVYMDAQCSLCAEARRIVEPYDIEQSLDFRDYNDSVIAQSTPYSAAELAREMHVQTGDGHWFVGYRAWVEILRVLPRWRWAAMVAAVPPLKWLGPTLYRLVAANRYHLARRLPSAHATGQCQRCDLDAMAERGKQD